MLASPAQGIREIYDLMPTATEDDWAVIARRLDRVGDALDGYTETLREGIANGNTPAVRQVREVLSQVRTNAARDGFFAEFTGAAEVPESLKNDLAAAAERAADAYGRFGDFLEGELAPAARHDDAVGRELYSLMSRRFLGATIDLDETYEWGKEELARMVEEQTRIANEILPGASVEEAIAHLEKDESRKLHGRDALKAWMQQLSDTAVDELSRTHFDIPEPVKALECMIAPTPGGAIYYTGPTDDFSRPGRMWWSIPEGVDSFDTWRETTTVYHEGVPGHHLQIGQAVYNRAELNSWRRLLAGTSGHAEGWALYAERLMEELGYLDDPADRLGMLDGQRMRAARVVLDIGVHLGKKHPDHRPPVDERGRLRVHAQERQHERRLRAVRGQPLPRLAGPGALLQGRSAHLGADPRRVQGPRGRGVLEQGLPQEGPRPRRRRPRHPQDGTARMTSPERPGTDGAARAGRVVIAGASGFIGGRLEAAYQQRGWRVDRIGRRERVRWGDAAAIADVLDGADVLINLAGRSVDCRCTAANRAEILRSRVGTTRELGLAIARAGAARPAPRTRSAAATAGRGSAGCTSTTSCASSNGSRPGPASRGRSTRPRRIPRRTPSSWRICAAS